MDGADVLAQELGDLGGSQKFRCGHVPKLDPGSDKAQCLSRGSFTHETTSALGATCRKLGA
jgi:hypothetical protein